MLRPKARWLVREAEEEAVETLVRELGLDRLIARLLVARGVGDTAKADLFLHTGKASFHDPYQMDGMDHAVRRIRQALEKDEKIRIYGDYDADGVSSTALMIHVMRELGASFDWYIPHRVREGYGLNGTAIEAAKESGVSLLITVDTGISAWEQIRFASELGIDVIVTDHHEPPERLPEACVVLNPKKPGCPYPFKQLAGVGVAFKLAEALLGRVPEELLELAAIGTVADLMPLTGENRKIVKLGLDRMRRSQYAGIRALLKVSGAGDKIPNATHVGFGLAPRINAGGRLESADEAVRLLVAERDEEAEPLALALDTLNKERQRLVEELTKEALQQAEQKPLRKALVLAREGWNVGVIGIVASKVLDKFYCPTLVFGIDPVTDMAKGSARSIAGFDMYRALTHCADLLDHFGGHQAAAGMTLHRDKLPELERRLHTLAEEWLSDDDYVPSVQVDLPCSLADVPPSTIRALEQLAPFGMGNPPVQVMFTGLTIGEIRTMGKEQQHLKLHLKETGVGAASIEAVGFGRARWLPQLSHTSEVDVLGELSMNEWNGVERPQLVIQDLRVPRPQLFDWRGAQDVERRWREVMPGQDPHVLQGAAVWAWGSTPGDSMLTAMNEMGCPLWTVGADGSLLAGNDAARKSRMLSVRDLLVVGLPSSLGQLEHALGEAPGLERIYASFRSGAASETSIPSRDMFKAAYSAVRQSGSLDLDDDRTVDAFSRRSGLPKAAIAFMLDVFEELAFLERQGRLYRAVPTPAKRELTASNRYQARLAQQEAERTLIYSSAQELTRWVISRIGATSEQEAIVHGL